MYISDKGNWCLDACVCYVHLGGGGAFNNISSLNVCTSSIATNTTLSIIILVCVVSMFL